MGPEVIRLTDASVHTAVCSEKEGVGMKATYGSYGHMSMTKVSPLVMWGKDLA